METEFKLRIPLENLKAVEAALRRGAVTRTRLQARYFDTADGALAAAGMALRLRKEGRRWIQTVKAVGAGPVQRLEHNVDLGAGAAATASAPDPLRHQGTPVGERLVRVLADSAAAALAETYTTDVWRLARVVRHGGATVELALDTGRITTPGPAGGGERRETAVCELELELLRGPVAGLVALAQVWVRRHGLSLSTVSKAERGERLMKGLVAVPAVKAVPPRVDAVADGAPDGAAFQRAVVVACLVQILPNADEIANGSEDAEQIHQLRIGIRRLRVALRELRLLAPGFDPAWEPPLVDAFRALGAQRDRDLVLAGVQAELRAADAPDISLPLPDEAAPKPGQIMRAPDFTAVLVALAGFVATPALLSSPAPSPAPPTAAAKAAAEAETTTPPSPAATLDPKGVRSHLRRRLRALRRKVVADGARFESLDVEAQHRVRKRLKRLRYLAEFAAPLFARERPARFLEALRPAQDALGRYNDAIVARALFAEAVLHDPRAWYALGWLDARGTVLARSARKALRRIDKTPPFWKRSR